MRAISLYSGGCDGLALAASWVGIETIAMCECDDACRKQLASRHSGKPIIRYDTEVLDGLRKAGIEHGDIDIILASPPCQCASVAGARKGASDERNRWPQFLEVVRGVRPKWVLAENVPGLLSVDDGRLFGTILGELAEMGYDAGWGVFGAADVGAPHRRDRLFIVAHAEGAECAGNVGHGHTAGNGGLANGGAMGNTKGERLQRKRADRKQITGTPVKVSNWANCRRYVGDAERGIRSRRSRQRARETTSDGCEQGTRSTQPGVGSCTDGILARLFAQRWPAPRNKNGYSPQYDWEPPRTVTGMKGRAALIKMFGNAVVPQWAAIVLSVIVEMERKGSCKQKEQPQPP